MTTLQHPQRRRGDRPAVTLLHGDNRECPDVLAGVFAYCHGHNVVPEEGPVEHLRNSLALLAAIEELAPVSYAMVPEIQLAERRIQAAVTLLECGGPADGAAMHVRNAIEALTEAKLDWKVLPEIRAAVTRCFTAWFALGRAT